METRKFIEELSACGWSQDRIGKAIGKSQAWVSAVSRGAYKKDVVVNDYNALKDLHRAVTTEALAA